MLSEKAKRLIESNIFKAAGVTKEEYLSWRTKNYSMDKGVAFKFRELLEGKRKIHIFGDYDCDGICSSFIMSRTIERLCGIAPEVHLPKRFTDGYGLKAYQIEDIYDNSISPENVAIITVDNGIASHDAINKAKESGYTVIVTDHHEGSIDNLPSADLLIDPVVKGINPFDFDGYCGAGVAYKIAEVLNLFSIDELYELKCYAALATIADVMPLVEENHTIVRDVLDSMAKGKMPVPIKMLGEETKNFDFTNVCEKDFGFTFAPIVNASSRLYDDGASDVFNFFKSPDKETAKTLVERNETRKDIVKEEYDIVKEIFVKNNLKTLKTLPENMFVPVAVYAPKLHEGIIGILAGKLAEDTGIPAIVLTDDPKNPDIVKGSARSITGFSIYDHLTSVPKEYFIGFGGHPGAAGMSINKERLEDFIKFQDSTVYKYPENTAADALLPVVIRKEDIPKAYEITKQYAPFGEGNPGAVFSVYLHKYYDNIMIVGKNKDILMLKNSDYNIVCFNLNKEYQGRKIQKLDVIGTLELDNYTGNGIPRLNALYVTEHGARTLNKGKDFTKEEIPIYEDNNEEPDYSE